MKADLILAGGTVYTMEESMPVAGGIAAKGNRILAVGTEEEILCLQGKGTTVIPLEGKTVIPGLVDAHVHLLSFGQSLRVLNLADARSWEEVADRVRAAAAQKARGEWILGMRWDQNRWKERAFPDHGKISAAAPDNPVWLIRVDLHCGIANRMALDAAGITARTQEPEGGKVLRHSQTGEPTGVLLDKAMDLVSRAVPQPTREGKKSSLIDAVHACLSLGLTGVHDAGVDQEGVAAYKELAGSGSFPFRVYGMLSGAQTEPPYFILEEPEIGLFDHRLTFRGIKLFMDGALGSRGAALFEEYADDPDNRGILTLVEEDLFSITEEALKRGFQMCTHAIGDRGVRMVLDTYERALAGHAGKDARLRLEHAQVVSLEDIPRFSRLGVLPSMQPTHATSDMPWAEARLGRERLAGFCAWRKFLDSGARIAGGSDFPVEHPNPLYGIYAAVTRQDHQGRPEGGWFPGECMAREEALSAFTRNAAYFAFEEDRKGSLAVGKLADMVVLSKDIMKVPPKEILDTQVVFTVFDGKVVYWAEE